MHSDDLKTDIEIQAEKDQRILSENLARSRARLARDNRKAGQPEPRAGMVMHVRVANGLKRRTRGGLKFSGATSIPVEVTELDDFDVAERQRAGKNVVNVAGAEAILADDALIVRPDSHGGEDVAAERARADAAEKELSELKSELAKLRAARQAAPESSEGRPTRLQAAARARGAGDAAVDPDGKLFPEKG